MLGLTSVFVSSSTRGAEQQCEEGSIEETAQEHEGSPPTPRRFGVVTCPAHDGVYQDVAGSCQSCEEREKCQACPLEAVCRIILHLLACLQWHA